MEAGKTWDEQISNKRQKIAESLRQKAGIKTGGGARETKPSATPAATAEKTHDKKPTKKIDASTTPLAAALAAATSGRSKRSSSESSEGGSSSYESEEGESSSDGDTHKVQMQSMQSANSHPKESTVQPEQAAHKSATKNDGADGAESSSDSDDNEPLATRLVHADADEVAKKQKAKQSVREEEGEEEDDESSEESSSEEDTSSEEDEESDDSDSSEVPQPKTAHPKKLVSSANHSCASSGISDATVDTATASLDAIKAMAEVTGNQMSEFLQAAKNTCTAHDYYGKLAITRLEKEVPLMLSNGSDRELSSLMNSMARSTHAVCALGLIVTRLLNAKPAGAVLSTDDMRNHLQAIDSLRVAMHTSYSRASNT